MNAKWYSMLKVIALVWLPALGTLVFAVTDLWNLQYGAQIVGTIMAIDTFLGAGLKFSPKPYDGELLVDTADPNLNTFRLDLTSAAAEWPNQKEVRLKVKPSAGIPPRV